jgi:hypothetical protein
MIQGDLRQKPKGQSNRERTECRIEARSAVIFVETERGRRRDEEPYSCTVTIPDGGIATGSAKSTALLE